MDDYAKAIAYFTERIRIDPEEAAVYINRGNVYDKMGEYDKVEADFAKAKDLGYSPE